MITIDTYYLIDFENVGSNGIVGCKGLKKTDHIHLFYTENAKKISLDFFEDHGEAELVIHKVPVRKQSLDMHLVSFLGYLIGQNPEQQSVAFRIVSKDTDYDNIIKFWKNEKSIEMSRISSIKAANRISKPRNTNKNTQGKTTAAKSPAAKTAAGSQSGNAAAKEGTSKFADTDNRTRLNNEVQQVLSKEGGYTSEVVCDVAKLSVGMIGEEHFQQKVHNELQSRYDNYSDIYTLIKPVLDQCAARQAKEAPKGESDADGARKPKENAASDSTRKLRSGAAKTAKKSGKANASLPAKESAEKSELEPKDVDHMELNSLVQKALSRAGLPPEVVGFVASTVVKHAEFKNGKQMTYRAILSKFGKKQGLDIYRTVKDQIPY